MIIRSGQSGEYGVMYSNGDVTVSCRQIDNKTEYLVTKNQALSSLLRNLPIIRVFEKLRLMFHNTHEHNHFLKGNDKAPKLMPFYLRFFLFMVIITPIYFLMMWSVQWLLDDLTNIWLELAFEGVIMYGLFMLVASGSMSARSKRYHSAEHQAVNAWRNRDGKMTIEEAVRASRFHASCGTGAAFSVAVGVFITLSIFYSFVPKPDFLLHSLLNIMMFPVGMSVGMELFSLIPFLYRKTGILLLVYPSFLLQRLTTKKATPDEIKVAVLAIEKMSQLPKS